MQRRIPAFTTRSMTKEQFFHAYQQLARGHSEHLLLESGRDGKISMAGVGPLAKLHAFEGNRLHIAWREGTEEVREGDPLELLTGFVREYEVGSIPELPEFQGGIAGFISYDYVRRYETLPDLATADVEVPDLHFYLFDEWAVYDIDEGKAYFIVLPESEVEVEEVASKWISAASAGRSPQGSSLETEKDHPDATDGLDVSVTASQFEGMVRDVHGYISQGEVTQVNLTVRQSKPLKADPLTMYAALRSVNPSPYMASIGSSDFAVVSGSPELLLKKRGNELSTRPIGGTRPRGTDEQEDAMYEADLLSSKKETSEHEMLVELEREDFERVCAPGTVETNEFMVVERYSHVMHLVSNVRGTVAEGISNADIVKSVFPGGTITGAPKLRTMEIIEALEPVRRGLYTGSIGWFGFNGDFELNVVIRTAFIRGGVAHIQAGAGIVKESVPEEEYIESLNKAKALWQAKALAENEQNFDEER